LELAGQTLLHLSILALLSLLTDLETLLAKTISTSNPKDFVIGAVGVKNAPTLTPAADFSLLKTQTNGGHVVISDEYKIVQQTQTNLPASYSWGGGAQDWAIIVDAIKAP